MLKEGESVRTTLHWWCSGCWYPIRSIKIYLSFLPSQSWRSLCIVGRTLTASIYTLLDCFLFRINLMFCMPPTVHFHWSSANSHYNIYIYIYNFYFNVCCALARFHYFCISMGQCRLAFTLKRAPAKCLTSWQAHDNDFSKPLSHAVIASHGSIQLPVWCWQNKDTYLSVALDGR